MIEVFKLAQGYYQIKLYWRLLGSLHSRAERRALQQPLPWHGAWCGLIQKDNHGWGRHTRASACHQAQAGLGCRTASCLQVTSTLAPSSFEHRDPPYTYLSSAVLSDRWSHRPGLCVTALCCCCSQLRSVCVSAFSCHPVFSAMPAVQSHASAVTFRPGGETSWINKF